MKKQFIIAIFLLAATVQVKAQYFPEPGCTTDVGKWILAEKDSLGNRGVGDNYHLWDNGQVLRIKFMAGGSKELRDKVIKNAKEWEKYANIKFEFLPDNTANTDIRIKLGRGYGHNSAVGTEAKFRRDYQQTVNFDTIYFMDLNYYVEKLKKKGLNPPFNFNQVTAEIKSDPNHWNDKELRRVVMHEFGHVLGLLHEQSYPGAINWKKTDSVYNYYQKTQGWNKQKVDFNVFAMSDQFYTNGTEYDPQSIMQYAIQPWQTTDGFHLDDNFELSDGDKKLIARFYPKDKTESDLAVAQVEISDVGELEVINDDVRKGLVIRPSFILKTNSKLGEVYFVARMADELGMYYKTDAKYYNWGGAVAAYRKAILFPNAKFSYNKGILKNLELFIPFDQLPSLEGKKVIVAFAVYLDDVNNNQMNKLMYFSTTTPLSIPTK
ncbi:MAG: matrixin family metalloprotease [Chitinophagaceae bacterium]|nr:matrixin family metalloprotease [Chitinophagaceae bacterium]